jgi:putative membrane protein
MLVRWLILAVGVLLATQLIPGIHCDGIMALIAVVLLLSLLNAILKPLLVLFTLPFILVTMGLGMVVINALLFLLAGRLVSGFFVSGFGSAVGGALVVSATHFVINRLARKKPGPPSPPGSREKGDDVIDI